MKKRFPQLTSSDLKEDSSVRMVFVTASPVLTNEVKTYYHGLKEKLCNHLHLKEIKAVTKEEGKEEAQGEELKAEELDDTRR